MCILQFVILLGVVFSQDADGLYGVNLGGWEAMCKWVGKAPYCNCDASCCDASKGFSLQKALRSASDFTVRGTVIRRWAYGWGSDCNKQVMWPMSLWLSDITRKKAFCCRSATWPELTSCPSGFESTFGKADGECQQWTSSETRVTSAKTIKACANACSRDGSCVAFDFNENKKCYLNKRCDKQDEGDGYRSCKKVSAEVSAEFAVASIEAKNEQLKSANEELRTVLQKLAN